ncbi:MAG: hypothetical protein J6Y60_03510 [Treponema sp.]|nr:hypothetical protein [Treponema sp.]
MGYPKPCRKTICRLIEEIGVDSETAYRMMLMTAALMDLHPEDDKVLNMILQDCGIEDVDIRKP